MKQRAWYALTAVIFVLGLAALGWGRVPAEGSGADLPPAPIIGHPAPGFALQTLEGEALSLADLQGQPVVLNFWATWCGPCRAEMPELQRLHERLGPAGVVVLGVNQNETPQAIANFRAELALDFPTVLDVRLGVSREYGVNSIPTTFFIDRQGVIRSLFIGPMTDAILADKLKTIYP